MDSLDYLIFSVGIIAIYFSLHLWLRKTNRANGIPWPLWLALGLLLGIGWLITDYAGTEARKDIQKMVQGFPPTYARETERMGHAQLTTTTSQDDPIYKAIIDAQIRWEKANTSIADIYTMRKTPEGKIVFIVDSETDYDRDGQFKGEREQRTPIGQAYEKNIPELHRAFEGFEEFVQQPYKDEWGFWVSAFVPLYDARGNQEGVLGVDYPAESWLEAIRDARNHSMIIIGFLALILGASCTVVIIIQNQMVVHSRLEQELIDIQEREQSRLGQDLHDDLGQQLTGIGMMSQRIATKLTSEQHPIAQSATELSGFIKDAIVTARNMARSFYPVELEGGGIRRAIEDFAQRTRKLSGIECIANIDANFSVTRDVAIHVYRLVQEAVNNAVKHGKPSRILIDAAIHNGVQTLTITDNGKGIDDAAKKNPGIGLHLFEYRAKIINADIEISNVPNGKGCRVHCVFQ